MDDKIINAGVIGCGGFCKGNHLPNLASNPGINIRALCDLNQATLDDLQNSYQPDYTTTDFQRIFDDPEIDMVVCATKPDFRLPIMRAAVHAGKPLFVEKPLCLNENDCHAMLELMSGSSIPFMVGFNRPFSPMMKDAERYYGEYRGDGNTTIIYRIIGEAQLWPPSHFDAVIRRGESTILHEVTHIFNLLNHLTGAFPVSIFAAGGGNTDNIITLEYPGRVTAVIIAGDNSCAGFPKEYLEINTAYTTIAGYHFVELDVLGTDGERHQRQYPYQVDQKTHTDGRLGMEERQWRFRQSITPEEMAYGYYYNNSVLVDKGHYGELEAFRQCIVHGTPSPVDVVQGAVANFIAWAAIESWGKGVKIKLNLSNLKKRRNAREKVYAH